jgi:hypothetical protein|tara:strand:+ start:4492 stop:4794 length:303 start_codon:yes stop_codon:yes gene_type:complete
MKMDYIESLPNHDIALDVYSTLMHYKVDKGIDHIDVMAVIEYLKHHYETDQNPVAVSIRNQNKICDNAYCEAMATHKAPHNEQYCSECIHEHVYDDCQPI